MQSGSILGKEFIEVMLATARKNLETDGYLCPVLFLRFEGGERAIYPLELARSSAEKRAYFAALGAALHRAGKAVQEAVFLSESWFLEVQKTVSALDIQPSRHPQRREAILVMGRDADGERVSSVVQPFSHQGHGQPIWGELALATYNTAAGTGFRQVGLLDDLFAANQRKEVRKDGTSQTF
jgi:hypothetical protein